MNCQEFTTSAAETARGLMTDERILAHADSCARCAARLAAERALSAGLRAAARDSAASETAPPRVEAVLLQAFRARHAAAANADAEQAACVSTADTAAAPTATVEAPSNVRSFVEAAAARRGPRSEARLSASRQSEVRPSTSNAGWWLRAAAALLVAVAAGVTAGVVYKSAPRTNGTTDTAERAANPAAAVPSKAAPTQVAMATADPASVVDETGDGGEEQITREARGAAPLYVTAGASDAGPESVGRPADAMLKASAARRANAARERGNGRLSRQALGALMANSRGDGGGEPEITTDFFPMSDASALQMMDGGHVIRVELPASALASYGLPVAADRANGRVKADVLIGSDGMARAIRFVR